MSKLVTRRLRCGKHVKRVKCGKRSKRKGKGYSKYTKHYTQKYGNRTQGCPHSGIEHVAGRRPRLRDRARAPWTRPYSPLHAHHRCR